MSYPLRRSVLGLSGLALLACSSNSPLSTHKVATTSAAAAHPASSAPGSSSPGTSRSVSPSVLPSKAVPVTSTGVVLGLDGLPAAGVTVSAYPLLSNNGGSVLANNGGALVANNGSAVISDNAAGLTAGQRRLLDAAPIQTKTATDGTFTLSAASGQKLNVEAVQNDTTKAIQQNVDAAATGLSLKLQFTGTLQGKVSDPTAATVTDFTGVQVFIPGTSYAAMTAKDGSYSIPNVPVGSFSVVGSKTGLGRAEDDNVQIVSKAIATANLTLALTTPVIAAVSPGQIAPGETIKITGSDFGASTGDTLDVTIDGAECSTPVRVDDRTINVTVPPSVTTSGNVLIKVGEVVSNAFPVVTLVNFQLPPLYRDIAVNAAHLYHVVGFDANGLAYPDPVGGQWGITDTIATVDPKGSVTATHPGNVMLTYTAGSKAASETLTFHTDIFATTVAGDGLGLAGYADGIFSRFFCPGGLAAGTDGTLYVADLSNNAIRKIALNGAVTTLAGPKAAVFTGVPTPFPTTEDPTDFDGSYPPSPAPQVSGGVDGAGVAARFNAPLAIAVDATGNLYVVDSGNARVRKIDPTGNASTYIQDNLLTAFSATGSISSNTFGLVSPGGVATLDNTVFVNDDGGGGVPAALYKIDPSGSFKGVTTGAGGLAFHLLDTAPQPTPTPSPTPYLPTSVSFPQFMAVGPDGTVYVQENRNPIVAFAPPAYQPQIVYSTSTTGMTGLAVDAKGTLYWTDASDLYRLSKAGNFDTYALALDGLSAFPTDGSLTFDAEPFEVPPPHANFGNIGGVAIGPNGEIYVSDNGFHCIRRIDGLPAAQ